MRATVLQKAKKKKRGHGRRKPQELPRRLVLHDVAECEKACPRCTFQREVCGRTVSLQLDYSPGHAFYWEHIRLKYACRACDGQVKIAPAPEYPIDRGMSAAGMLSYLATSKYADHLPLYRLEGILSQQGLVLSRSTMCDWMQATSKIVLPLFEYLTIRIKKSRVIWTDDTPGSRDGQRTRKALQNRSCVC
jgi:transposase